MPWLLVSPCHQQLWHWLCRIKWSLSSRRKDFNYIHKPSHSRCWEMVEMPIYFFFWKKKKFSTINNCWTADTTERWITSYIGWIWWLRARLHRVRHLLFPQLGSRTTIKQYGFVRNRNLLGHDDNILPFTIKKWGELYICIFNLISRLLCLKHTVTS